MPRKERKHTRRSTDEYYIVIDKISQEPLGRIANVSTGGLKLISSAALQLGHSYQCEMNLPEEILGHRSISFEVECRWSRQSESGATWESGCEFKRISSTAMEVMQQLSHLWMMSASGGIQIPRQERR